MHVREQLLQLISTLLSHALALYVFCRILMLETYLIVRLVTTLGCGSESVWDLVLCQVVYRGGEKPGRRCKQASTNKTRVEEQKEGMCYIIAMIQKLIPNRMYRKAMRDAKSTQVKPSF